jgi:uncharacterized protein (TIRG00374 family)
LLAALSVWAVVSQSKELSLSKMSEMIRNSDPLWFAAGILCMFGFIYFEGAAILCIIKSIGYPRSQRAGLVYSASDIYFSAITPSATGGQPASAFFMVRDGIPIVKVTAVLIVNLVMYTLAILTIGVLCVVIEPGLFFGFSPLSKILIVFGFAALVFLAIMFYFLLRRRKWVFFIGKALISLMGRLHLTHDVEGKTRRLARKMADYKNSVDMMSGKYGMLIKAYLFNLAQRASQITVTLMMYLATGGLTERSGEIWATQSFTVIGSNCIPIPGAMGVSDYLLLDGLGRFMDNETAVKLELLSRSVSFYSCVIISGIIVIAGYFIDKNRNKRTE